MTSGVPITDSQRARIIDLVADGDSYQIISEKCGVNDKTISQVVRKYVRDCRLRERAAIGIFDLIDRE